MVLPREDLMARSPSVFFSATSPEGCEPFQVQLAIGEYSVLVTFGRVGGRGGDDIGCDGEQRWK